MITGSFFFVCVWASFADLWVTRHALYSAPAPATHCVHVHTHILKGEREHNRFVGLPLWHRRKKLFLLVVVAIFFFFKKKERKKDIQNKEEENIFSSSFDINTYYTVPWKGTWDIKGKIGDFFSLSLSFHNNLVWCRYNGRCVDLARLLISIPHPRIFTGDGAAPGPQANHQVRSEKEKNLFRVWDLEWLR